jgi:hypothetical protein
VPKSNRERGELQAIIGDEIWVLAPSYYALAKLEDLLDDQLENILQRLQRGRRSGLIQVVWCLLQEHHEAVIVTLKDAAQWIERAGEDRALEWTMRVMELNADDPAADGADGNPTMGQPAPADGETPLPVPAVSV